ncbi:RNA polymerase sigma-70 factor [Pedobacter cryoconitis]|uniref:RNA polymerase sigma-70 factor (ECF subfamily) n=1 Tax=Pedobacter cryoconitis TaxID=188932 RepID=A0A7X0J8C0_9SPHI|nr:RNA polymerase sigma-70 factor [Pedobacter cryoconitis]MBB6502524.1 RNA polymerase sigma-70 factor (ECF subfamily) [Pedobacter cryoconitis]
MSTYNSLSDLDLNLLLRDGDENAFAEIYHRYFKVLFIHAFKRLKDEEEAMDVVQDLFEFVWSKREQLEITTKFSSYLYAAVRNRIFTLGLRSDRKIRYLDSLKEFIDKGEFLTDIKIREWELTALIEKEINALPPQMKKVFEMSRKEGKSHKDIASELGTSEHTVRTQIKNSLRILRSRLGIIVYLLFLLNQNRY